MDFSLSNGLAEQIAAYLEDRIIRLAIKPGERIREAVVAEELGVSRSPVREALRILENNHVVELTPRRGARVTVISETFISDLCDVLAELLGLAGSKCPANGTDEELAVIDEAAKRSWTCANNGNLEGQYKAVFDFGVACLKATKNQLLEQMVTELLPNLRRIIYATFSAMGDAIRTNADIVITGNNYVQQRNAAMAEKTVRDYTMRMRAYALENNTAAILFGTPLS
ncbi:MAG: GntR family transcriptional regulator [Thermodesulfobacteriota bacterium]|nr:GntR family transcriptional regulator [Thermodesulfobacteriota bacterium]